VLLIRVHGLWNIPLYPFVRLLGFSATLEGPLPKDDLGDSSPSIIPKLGFVVFRSLSVHYLLIL
ncbi:hypothetical protein SESBI_42208, partial [Sesbania bispinosa]